MGEGIVFLFCSHGTLYHEMCLCLLTFREWDSEGRTSFPDCNWQQRPQSLPAQQTRGRRRVLECWTWYNTIWNQLKVSLPTLTVFKHRTENLEIWVGWKSYLGGGIHWVTLSKSNYTGCVIHLIRCCQPIGQRTLSWGSCIRYPTYKLFPLWFITVVK